MLDTAQARAEAALRRDATLEAVAFATQRFLEAPSWEDGIEQVLRRLGEANGVSRLYLIQTRWDEDGTLLVTQRFEWVAPGVSSQMGNPDLEEASMAANGLGRWIRILGRGDIVHGAVDEFPEIERPHLAGQDIRSILVVPIFVAGEWWGCIGFDDCENDRRWTQSEIDALRAAAGTLGAAVHRQRSEERLRRAETRFRALVERMPGATYLEEIAEDGQAAGAIRYMSPQIEHMLGYPVERWVSDREFWIGLIHDEDRQRVLTEFAGAATGVEPTVVEYRMVSLDGREVWIHEEAMLVEGSEGGPQLWQGFMLDITERKEGERLLRAAEEKYRTLVEQNPAVIYTQEIDADDPTVTKTVYVSPNMEPLIGYSADEMISNPLLWREILHPNDRDRVLAEDVLGNRSGDAFNMEYRMVGRDGRVLWIHDEAFVVRDAQGRPRLWQGFMLDISERKHAEEQIARALAVEREATRRLRAVDEMKNTFLQAVSHDLRTPLAAILGLAVTLERADIELDPAEARDLARRIAANSRKLDRLVNDLLDLDRLARGIVEPKLHATDVGSLVRRVLAESDLLGERPVQVEADPVVVDVDAAKVERIVENLLSNTARHTPADTRVWVRVRAEPGGVLIVVEDEGPGIPDDHRESIFEPFRQGPEAPSHSPGVGVGLTLVSRFAQLHGGRAWVEDREGGGSSFRVFLLDGAGKQAQPAGGEAA